jgi:SAM-dependent methyltransferase
MTMTTGIPDLAEVDEVVAGALFRDMEAYSDAFLARNHDALEYYSRVWVADPLHNWSRRWEYPFIFEQLKALMPQSATVLDAGSGATFFPYYIADQIPGTSVVAVDYDAELGSVYETAKHEAVSFAHGDITKLDFPDRHFDAAYSVSVLEHIPQRFEVSAELARIMKPGAPLVLTVDVSLDEHHDIPIPQAQELIDGLREFFEPVGEVPPLATAAMAPSALLTTRLDPADWPDWPWRFSLRTRAIMLKHRRWPFPLTPKLTVYGSSWRRRS